MWIYGVFNLNTNTVSKISLEKMASTIRHRGPDGEGYYVKNNIALAQKRLAI